MQSGYQGRDIQISTTLLACTLTKVKAQCIVVVIEFAAAFLKYSRMDQRGANEVNKWVAYLTMSSVDESSKLELSHVVRKRVPIPFTTRSPNRTSCFRKKSSSERLVDLSEVD